MAAASGRSDDELMLNAPSQLPPASRFLDVSSNSRGKLIRSDEFGVLLRVSIVACRAIDRAIGFPLLRFSLLQLDPEEDGAAAALAQRYR